MEILAKRIDFNDLADLEEAGKEIPEEHQKELRRINKAIEPELDRVKEALKVLEPFLNDEGRIDRETLEPFLNDDGSLNADKINEFHNQIVAGINLDRLLIPKDKSTRTFFSGELENGIDTELIFARNGQSEITADIIVHYPIIEGVEIESADISFFDYSVYYAISTLYVDSESKIFSIPTIYRNMIADPKGRCPEIKYNQISDSIRKLSKTSVKIEDTRAAKLWKHDEVSIEENMLMTRRYTIKSGGYKVEGIEIITKPLLYWYASLKKQIAVVPSKVLKTPIENRNSGIELKTFLIDKVEWFKGNGKQKNDTILYSEIYQSLKVETRSAKDNTRKNIIKILDYWKEINYIKEYKLNKGSKNALLSLKIIV